MQLPKYVKDLCTPALIYLVISAFTILSILFQNVGNTNKYCVGDFECPTKDLPMVFIVKVLYVAFWTYVLNLMCSSGFKTLAWFIVIIPFVLFAIAIGSFMYKAESPEQRPVHRAPVHHPMVPQTGSPDPVPQYGPQTHFNPNVSVDFTGEASGYDYHMN